MLMLRFFKNIRAAIASLNPDQVRERADRPLRVGLVAQTSQALAAMEDFLVPARVSHKKRLELMHSIYRPGDPGTPPEFDLVLREEGVTTPSGAFTFHLHNPGRTVDEILMEREDLSLALARNFPPFRAAVVEGIIDTIAKENALFALATAVPNLAFLQFPWAAGEFASDTAVLTMNQIRMAFLIGAASDRAIGYGEQKGEIASIITGAFGWRSIARELAGKIPFGGGLIPKGAIAWAGTYVVGLSLDRFNRIGYGLNRSERRKAYRAALERGREVARILVHGSRDRSTA